MSIDDARRGVERRTQNRSQSSFVLLTLVLALSVGGVVAVYGLLYSILVSDSVNIVDEATLRQAAKDSVDLNVDVSRREPVKDDSSPLDAPVPSTGTKDDLAISDSAQATSSTYYQVTAASVFDLSDSPSSGTAALDNLVLQDKDSLQKAVDDALLMVDSTARMLFLYITDSLTLGDQIEIENDQAEDEEEERRGTRGGGNRGPERIVYENSYFEDRPLSRLKVTGIDTTNSERRVVTQVRQDQAVGISIGIRNFQNIVQGYTLFVQITDENGVAVRIVQLSGSVDAGEQAKLEDTWIPQLNGVFTMTVFVCDDNLEDLTVISETFRDTIGVQ